MGPTFLWHLATEGDTRGGARDPTGTPAHWAHVALAAEHAGFRGLQVPGGPHRPDPWVTTAWLARQARTLQFLVAFRPGLQQPAPAAQSVASLQQLIGPRLRLSLFAGNDVAEQRAFGDLVHHDDRFARAAEFLAVVRQAWQGRPGGIGFRHDGAHYRIQGGGLVRPLRTPPPLHLGGMSPAAERVAAEHADVFTLWADTPPRFGERVRRLQALAAGHGRALRFACRAHVIADETEAGAWRRAQALLDRWAPGSPSARSLEVSPQVWAGHARLRTPGLVRHGAALVGSHAQVAERLGALHALGADHFVLSGEHGLEDVLRLGEDVLPFVPARTAAGPDPVPRPEEAWT